ncbi:MAG: PLDc N-terminal domain-containing protein [Defluviitaleaceae bacterium]|nr:PLDc N-terminal domain-containing protein [Defluviitaleaceae bacterium]
MFNTGNVFEIGGITLDLGTLLIFAAPLIIINFVLLVVAILSLARKPLPWGQKWVWLLVILLVDLIGPIIYFAVGSNMLDDKVAQLEDLRRDE